MHGVPLLVRASGVGGRDAAGVRGDVPSVAAAQARPWAPLAARAGRTGRRARAAAGVAPAASRGGLSRAGLGTQACGNRSEVARFLGQGGGPVTSQPPAPIARDSSRDRALGWDGCGVGWV